MNVAEVATTRHTSKAFDASRRIPDEILEQLCTVLRFAPSSVNSQPWHFIVAGSNEAKARIGETLQGAYAYNEPKVRNASHVVVFCARTDLDEAHLANLLAQEDRDGRFASAEARAGQDKSRHYYVGLHRDERKDLAEWIDRQVYIALGTLMFSAAAVGVDACAMEGIDTAALDAALGLPEKGLRSVVLLALGYRSEGDFNASLPKSRLPMASVLSTL